MASLDSLPIEMKQIITALLYECDSLLPLRQVSKIWYHLTEPYVYRGLAWAVDPDRYSIREDAELLLCGDKFTSKFLKHARHIYVYEVAFTDNCSYSGKFCTDRYTDPAGPSGITPLSSDFETTQPTYRTANRIVGTEHEHDRSAAERFWAPFVAALANFDQLNDIIFETDSCIPPGLLAVIEKHHPKCRLHLRNFRFKSLNDEVTDPDERALVMSKNLHTLNIRCTIRDNQGTTDHNELAAWHTVRLANNLKHVQIQGVMPERTLPMSIIRQPLEEWKGFVPPLRDEQLANEVDERQKTKLESLYFVFRNVFDVPKFAQWEKIIDFSFLKALEFATWDRDLLHFAARRDLFPSLEYLRIELITYSDTDWEDWSQAAGNFFDSLPPLASIYISGVINDSILNTIAKRHGPSLEILRISPQRRDRDPMEPVTRITYQEMRNLVARSPKLRHLTHDEAMYSS